VVVVTFKAGGAGNCATVAGTPYMYARTEMGAFVLPVRCAHRGGPLNLATLEPGRGRLVCPWHGRATSVTRLLRRGSPAVRRGEIVTAVLPEPASSAYELGHRPVSAELGGAHRVGALTGRPDPAL
jgi:hypothetical protein